MATSTALRFRNRSQPNPVVVSDALADLQSNVARILSDSVVVTDSEIVTYRRLSPGDRLTLVTDGDSQRNLAGRVIADSVAVTDSLTVVKSTRKILSDYTSGITDAGFITDKDFLRYRQTVDSLRATDSFQKTITLADFQIINKIILEDIDVTDTALTTVAGIIQRTLLDNISVADAEKIRVAKMFAESITASDSSVFLREVNRVLPNNRISVTDDVIVGRSAIINVETLSDSLSVIDRKTATRVPYVKVSAKILHGIENQ